MLWFSRQLVLVLGLLSPILAGKADAAPQTLTIVVPAIPGDLHPYAIRQDNEVPARATYSRPLVTSNRNRQFVCVLCQTIPSLDEGSLKIIRNQSRMSLRAVWTLRSDITWGDGTPLSPKDFVLAWEVAKAAAAKNNYLAGKIADITEMTLDPANKMGVAVSYARVIHEFNHLEWLVPLPSHIEQTLWKESGNDWEKYTALSQYRKAFTNPGLVLGNFAIAESDSSSLQLKRLANRPGPTGGFSNLIVRSVASSSALQALMATTPWLVTTEDTLSQAQWQHIDDEIVAKDSPWKIYPEANGWVEQLAINLRNPVLGDATIRRALMMAINCKAMMETLHRPATACADQLFAGNDPRRHRGLTPLIYDVENANKLLAQGGWHRNKGEPWLFRDAQKLQFSLAIPGDTTERIRLAGFLREQWRKIGVQVDIETHTREVFFRDVVRKSHYTGMALFAWQTDIETVPRAMFHSREIPAADNNYSGQNSMSWRNGEVDSLLEKLAEDIGDENTTKLFGQFATEWQRDLPLIPLFYANHTIIAPMALRGFMPTDGLFPTTLNVGNWTTGGSVSQAE